jgi:hypothetical protein
VEFIGTFFLVATIGFTVLEPDPGGVDLRHPQGVGHDSYFLVGFEWLPEVGGIRFRCSTQRLAHIRSALAPEAGILPGDRLGIKKAVGVRWSLGRQFRLEGHSFIRMPPEVVTCM